MARSLNTMLAGFQGVISQVNLAVDTMNSSTTALSDNAAKTVTDIERKKEETSMINHAITEMFSMIEEIARNTEKTAHKAITEDVTEIRRPRLLNNKAVLLMRSAEISVRFVRLQTRPPQQCIRIERPARKLMIRRNPCVMPYLFSAPDIYSL